MFLRIHHHQLQGCNNTYFNNSILIEIKTEQANNVLGNRIFNRVIGNNNSASKLNTPTDDSPSLVDYLLSVIASIFYSSFVKNTLVLH